MSEASTGITTASSGTETGASWLRPYPSRGDYRVDAIIAGILLIATGVSIGLYQSAGLYPTPAPLWVSALYALTITVPLAFRRRWPEAVSLVIAVGFVASQLLKVPEVLFCNITLFVAIYSVGAWGRSRQRATAVRAFIVLGMFTWIFIELFARASDPSSRAAVTGSSSLSPYIAVGFIQLITNLLYFGAAYYFGERAWSAARSRQALEDRTRQLAEERELNSQRAVVQERLRIARDLHDVVAHHVSVMGVQAGAARRVIDTDREQVIASLLSIESNARTAVTELHRMLSTLRSDATESGEPDAAAYSPSTRGLAQLDDLADQSEAAGLRVEYRTVGKSRTVSPTIGVTVYRVAQEAITNALKHGGVDTAVDMRLRYLDSSVELEVSSRGRGGRAPARGGGLGLVGMRERVDAVGGTLSVGPTEGNGYLVRATIPSDRS